VLIVMSVICATGASARCAGEKATMEIRLGERLGPLEMDCMALGQGGLSDQPMWDSRVAEVKALRPRIIRLFIQEYFRLLPEPGRYHFETLDRSVDNILAAGAEPLMCICFKPRTLFPKLDQDVVEPSDYAPWDELITRLVRHYRERGSGIRYWEVGNEPDIGEDGGCPYRFKPESYVRYYAHTAAAVLRTDPQARVGGPALANSRSPILPALLDAAENEKLPLHFVSWHIYSSSPAQIRETVEYVRGLLAKHPALKPETVLDEWNMDLMNPPLDPRFQPCYLLEAIWQMKDAGLDWSCYYHIRDWHVAEEQFAPFMSPRGTAFMARWWNRMPQFDGLFDYQNTLRPAYFAFKLLSRLTGERLRVVSSHPAVHAFATHDEHYRTDSVLVWNFSPDPVRLDLTLAGLPRESLLRHVTLDALASGSDENLRLRPRPASRLAPGDHRLAVELAPYGIEFWSLE
jgi:xylan 1,4-beta-xylosidase